MGSKYAKFADPAFAGSRRFAHDCRAMNICKMNTFQGAVRGSRRRADGSNVVVSFDSNRPWVAVSPPSRHHVVRPHRRQGSVGNIHRHLGPRQHNAPKGRYREQLSEGRRPFFAAVHWCVVAPSFFVLKILTRNHFIYYD